MLPNSSDKVIATARQFRKLGERPGVLASIQRKIVKLRHRFWSAVSGSDIILGATIGSRVSLPHPNGVVIHQNAVIGDDCMIMQQVTVGVIRDGRAPKIGSGVYIGAGAKIIGDVAIGDGARIGANAVVLSNVPAGATAVGVPARIINPARD